MLTDGFLFNHSISLFQEFDQRRPRLYPLDVSPKTRRTVTISIEVVEAAKQRGMSVGDYVLQLHHNQRSARVAYVSSIFRGFALLEMARVPIDPAYFELVEGCMSEDESREFRVLASNSIRMTPSIPLKKTALFDAHQKLGARLVDFGGWHMPVQYSGIIEEHKAVREAAGVFDISHMGEFFVSSQFGTSFLNGLLTNDVTRLSEGQGQYTLMLNDQGGVIDDLIIYRL